MAMDLMGGRGSKKSSIKSPVSEGKVGVRGKSSMKLMPKRKMKGRR